MYRYSSIIMHALFLLYLYIFFSLDDLGKNKTWSCNIVNIVFLFCFFSLLFRCWGALVSCRVQKNFFLQVINWKLVFLVIQHLTALAERKNKDVWSVWVVIVYMKKKKKRTLGVCLLFPISWRGNSTLSLSPPVRVYITNAPPPLQSCVRCARPLGGLEVIKNSGFLYTFFQRENRRG